MYRLAVDPASAGAGSRSRSCARASGTSRRWARAASRRSSPTTRPDAVGLWAAAGYARDADIARFVRNLE